MLPIELIVIVIILVIIDTATTIYLVLQHHTLRKEVKEKDSLHKYLEFLDNANVSIYTEYQKALNQYKEHLKEHANK